MNISQRVYSIMNLQIIGTKKCKETQKAERYFSERRIPFHFKDLIEKGFARVKEFSWEKTAKETLKVYQEVGNK